jgi:hypothetical protein
VFEWLGAVGLRKRSAGDGVLTGDVGGLRLSGDNDPAPAKAPVAAAGRALNEALERRVLLVGRTDRSTKRRSGRPVDRACRGEENPEPMKAKLGNRSGRRDVAVAGLLRDSIVGITCFPQPLPRSGKGRSRRWWGRTKRT